MYLIKSIVQKAIDKLVLGNNRTNYRAALHSDLCKLHSSRLAQGCKILEIGSRDGEDTNRLLTFNPSELHLLDLPGGEQAMQPWFKEICHNLAVRNVEGNLAYDKLFKPAYFDLIWCTGVLYHNTEQLRFLRHLYDLLCPTGILVLESATIKNPKLRNLKVVEVVYPLDEHIKKRYHLSSNITHLPSKKTILTWMEMLGFENIFESNCFKAQSFFLGQDRAAFICNRPVRDKFPVSPVQKQSNYLFGRSI